MNERIPEGEVIFEGETALIERLSTGTVIFTQKLLGELTDQETGEQKFSWDEFMKETISAFKAMEEIVQSSTKFPAILFDYNDCRLGKLPLNAVQLLMPVRELISGLRNQKGAKAYIVVAGFPNDNIPLNMLFNISSTSARKLGIVSRLNKVNTREDGINELDELIAEQFKISNAEL